MVFDSEPRILITRDKIDIAVKKIAAGIKRDYENKTPILIGVLKGSFIFMADLVRYLDFPLELDFIGVSSYGGGTGSTGKIRIVNALHSSIKDRDIILVDEIVDTGLTPAFLINYLQKKNPSSLKLCVLLDKTSRRISPVKIDYCGLPAPDKFLVGYGMDYDEKYRNLPDICFINIRQKHKPGNCMGTNNQSE